jgi:DNA-binding transcriptional MerR regulator
MSSNLVKRSRSSTLRLDLEAFARAANLHPDLVRRFVTLGLLTATMDADGTMWFEPAQLREAARITRLRSGFALNYAAIGLVADLLDRIDKLEALLQSASRKQGGPWT